MMMMRKVGRNEVRSSLTILLLSTIVTLRPALCLVVFEKSKLYEVIMNWVRTVDPDISNCRGLITTLCRSSFLVERSTKHFWLSNGLY